VRAIFATAALTSAAWMTLSSRLGLPACLAAASPPLSSDVSEIELVLSFRRIGADSESCAELEHGADLPLPSGGPLRIPRLRVRGSATSRITTRVSSSRSMQRDISEAYVLPGKINSISVQEVPKLTAISKLERSRPVSVGI
jgi:hypothetical protein